MDFARSISYINTEEVFWFIFLAFALYNNCTHTVFECLFFYILTEKHVLCTLLCNFTDSNMFTLNLQLS